MYRHLNDIQSSQYDRFIAVMQKSVFLALKYGSQAMMVTSDEKPKAGGSIVVTSSIAALLGSFADVAYSELQFAPTP
jgi:NAD(P)-dependent dehydrogenase (short-subunit alcohol dehydrogenase family)